MKPTKWTPQELAIVQNGKPTAEQAPHLPGRTWAAIVSKKAELKIKSGKGKREFPGDAYKGEKVKLYRYITHAEANTERVKQWGRESQKNR